MSRIRPVLCSAFCLLLVVGCKNDDTSTNAENNSPNPANSPNIPRDSIVTTASGGDVRGFFAANTPFYYFTYSVPPSGGDTTWSGRDSVLINSGSGTIKFEGSSANNGTYSVNNLTRNFDAYVILTGTSDSTGGNRTIVTHETSTTLPTTFLSNGTWSSLGATTIVMTAGSVSDTMEFTATSRGIFLAKLYQMTIGGIAVSSRVGPFVFKK